MYSLLELMVRTRFNWIYQSVIGFIIFSIVNVANAQTIFVCEPEWAALVKVLVPEVKMHVATHAQQDPHHIEARPALIAQLRSAEMAVCTGAALESWLPVLQQRSGNAKVQDGQPGMFYASDHVNLLNPQPNQFGHPFSGDIHAKGNPHFHADPYRLLQVMQALAARMQTMWPSKKPDIAKRLANFETSWNQRILQWEQRALPLRQREYVAQHNHFAYLWGWLGIQQVADLEPKPGMAPTPSHLQRTLHQLRGKPPKAVIVSSYQDPRAARWLSGQFDGKVPVIVLPATVEDHKTADALGLWFDRLIDALLSKSVN